MRRGTCGWSGECAGVCADRKAGLFCSWGGGGDPPPTGLTETFRDPEAPAPVWGLLGSSAQGVLSPISVPTPPPLARPPAPLSLPRRYSETVLGASEEQPGRLGWCESGEAPGAGRRAGVRPEAWPLRPEQGRLPPGSLDLSLAAGALGAATKGGGGGEA